jgi:outer membrane protein OmpU
MINLKKIGLTALTGSLVAFSANAADFSGSVKGAVETTYVTSAGTAGNNLTGNSFGANSALTLSASGDVGFGTVSATRAFGDMGGIATAYQTLDMGDRGILSFDTSAGALVGLTANDDLLPTAYEESWTGVAGDGIAGVGSTNVIGYRNTVEGVSISAGYSQLGTATGESASSGDGAHGSSRDLYISSAIADGLVVGAGIGQSSSTSVGGGSGDREEIVAHAVYTMGAISAGLRYAEIEAGTAGADDSEYMGASVAFNVNENFAVSYGMQEAEKGSASDEDVWGISAAYTVGAASVRLHTSESKGTGHVTNAKDENTEIGVVLAF